MSNSQPFTVSIVNTDIYIILDITKPFITIKSIIFAEGLVSVVTNLNIKWIVICYLLCLSNE